MSYKFQGGTSGAQSSYSVLPEGDYTFLVLECGEPQLNEKDHWVIKVKLSILPSGEWVWARPWSGETSTGEPRDGIGDFLLAINRAVPIGQSVDFESLVGAQGRCRLKIGKNLKDQPRNDVERFHQPKEIGPTAKQHPKTYSQAEVNKATKVTQAKAAPSDLDQGPDDIPF